MNVNDKFPRALPSGTVLSGQYIIDDVLGQGGFGITYKATDYKTKEKVAIKEFFPDMLVYREGNMVISYSGERTDDFRYGISAFFQEAKTLAEFRDCEGIAKIHSYFKENGTAYFAMDYVEGKSLDQYIKDKGGMISYDEIEPVLISVMDTLASVHRKGVIHRDLAPDNILITNEGDVKVLDFGAARFSLGEESKSLDVIYKSGFTPKEQYTRRGRQGAYTDVYSLGATFYFALTGKKPPNSFDRMEEDRIAPLDSLGVVISKKQENAIMKALNVQPDKRYQSMAEFKNALINETMQDVILKQQSDFKATFDKLDAESMYKLGFCYDRGIGVVRDVVRANECYKKAAKDGSADAMYQLGRKYDIDKLFAEMHTWYEQAANNGNVEAMYCLANCYAIGRGVSRNDTTAFEWYRKASEVGKFRSAIVDGTGNTHECDKTYEWYKENAKKGNAEAMYQLGICYATGNGVHQDVYDAYKWYMGAALKGNAEAMYRIGRCYDIGEGVGVAKSFGEAYNWYKKAAEKGNIEAMYCLANCYALGRGISKDGSKAFEYHKKASDEVEVYSSKKIMKEIST